MERREEQTKPPISSGLLLVHDLNTFLACARHTAVHLDDFGLLIAAFLTLIMDSTFYDVHLPIINIAPQKLPSEGQMQ